jgi:hypothetical protein
MFFIAVTHFQLGAIAATSFALAMLPSAGYAYTADQEQACTGDAFRLCAADIPDVDRITACMIRNKAQLSPGCRGVFPPRPGAVAPIDIKPVAARKSAAKPHRIKKRPKPAAT